MSFLSFLGYAAAILGINFACIAAVVSAIYLSEKPAKGTDLLGKRVYYKNA